MAHPEAMGPNVGGETPGRRRMNASQNEFAQRMMSKPMPESLNSDPEHRLFFDPPEIIQIAFGGRPWFIENDCTRIHRVGLFRGLGWQLSPVLCRDQPQGINGVRIKARANTGRKEMLFDMEFMRRELAEDHFDGQVDRVVTHRPGVPLSKLVATYAEVLGEAAI